MSRISDWLRSVRAARLQAAIREEPTPRELAAITELSKEKQLAIIAVTSTYLQINANSEEEEVLQTVAAFMPDLNNPWGMHPGASHMAYSNIILHLVKELAAARSESVEQVWQRAAAELTRQASE